MERTGAVGLLLLSADLFSSVDTPVWHLLPATPSPDTVTVTNLLGIVRPLARLRAARAQNWDYTRYRQLGERRGVQPSVPYRTGLR